MGGCAVKGGCPTDYIAVSIAALSMILLLTRSALPFLVHKIPQTRGSGFWLLFLQVFASFNLLLSLVMSVNFLKFERRHWWQSCYIWAGWFEGPFGFGLLMSCRFIQAFKLYHLFVKRRLPPMRTYILLPLILLPWIGSVAFLHIRKPLNPRCHFRNQWIIPIAGLHTSYIASMVGITRALRHIDFRFHEFKDLLQGIVVSTIAVGVWVAAYIMNEVHENIAWLQVTSRFLLLVMASILVLAFYTLSISQPLLSQMSLRKKDQLEFKTMGQALGIPDSGVLVQRASTLDIDPNEPLDKLLQNKRFRQSFMAFADSCLAGESVHFCEEVSELDKIPVNDSVRRVYMARHIIEKYIVIMQYAGATMEVNISHRTRQEILDTLDLAQPGLFNNAVNELMHLMKMNLVNDYWSSMFFMKFKEESSKQHDSSELMERLMVWDYSPRLSSVHGAADDPFHQEQPLKVSNCKSDIYHAEPQ
ncbi:Regulator of G protein signaling [Macleaya cordata]|uniref:Regulator of G protein signaling n=1 Tax=Macleaya cordata TaxID=56857 RepID=A0A200R4J1_MACCD|nr:Regulator of G protein signaling [Macleaya cordata]